MKACVDYNGKEFKSLSEMCIYHGVSLETFRGRIKRGLSLEIALSPKRVNSKYDLEHSRVAKTCTDHLGKTFPSIRAMCMYWDIEPSAYTHAIQRGTPQEIALTRDHTYKKHIKDHLGNEYESISDLCKQYNISNSMFGSRMRSGLSIEECIFGKYSYEDHEGNKFKSEKDMCKYWNIKQDTYRNRRKRYGYTLKEALTIPLNKHKKRTA